MILVGFVLSERVLARLADTQERHFRDLAQSYLDGLSSSIMPSVLREDTWEVFDAIERAHELNKGVRPRQTVVTTVDGRVVAASDPKSHPVGSSLSKPTHVSASGGQNFGFEAGATEATAVRQLAFPGRVVGVIHATFDTSHLAAERRGVILALAATNGALTLMLAAAGWLFVARLMRPVRILTEHLGTGDGLTARPIPAAVVARDRGEFRHLFEAFNGLVGSMDERELLIKRLAEEEKLGSLGRLSSALAHEINNPLGGLFNGLATLKSHGHIAGVRASTLGLLERGLVSIRDVVRTTLTIHRTEKISRDVVPADIDDVVLLIALQARKKSVRMAVANALPESISLPSTPIRQAVLNILLNAVAAAPEGSEVSLSAVVEAGVLVVTVTDRGEGLSQESASVLAGPTERAPLHEGAGLGLWTTRRLIGALSGSIDVAWPQAGGTTIRLQIPFRRPEELSHVA